MLVYGDSQWQVYDAALARCLAQSFPYVAVTNFRAPRVDVDTLASPDVVVYSCSERQIPRYLSARMSILRLTDSLPELPQKAFITEKEYGQWIGHKGICVVALNGIPQEKPQETGATLRIESEELAVLLQGWAADFANEAPFQALYLQAGDRLIQCDYGLPNTEVARLYGSERLLDTSFEVSFPVEYLTEARADELSFIAVSADGTYLYERANFTIIWGSASTGQ